MTTDEVKELIQSAKSIERESARMEQEIEQQREELLSIKSAMSGNARIISSEQLSMPERVYFRLENLYIQYGEVLQRLSDKRRDIENAIAILEPIEQEIARAWIAGKTEEEIGDIVGYCGRTVRRKKKRILVKLAKIKSCPPMS